MELGFGSQHEAETYSDAQLLRRAYGELTGKRISLRLSQIDAAANLARLSQLPQARCQRRSSNDGLHYAIAIDEEHMLIVAVANEPVPYRPDGTIELERVLRLKFIELRKLAPKSKEGE